MTILKTIGNYFLNILGVICIAFITLLIAIFMPTRLSSVIIEADKEIRKTRKKSKK